MVEVRIRFAPVRLLVQRLVMPDTDSVCAYKRGSDPPDPRMECERSYGRRILPKVDALAKRLLIAGSILELAFVPSRSFRNGFVNRLAVSVKFVNGEHVIDDDKALTLERL
jgi:hypothetical protein